MGLTALALTMSGCGSSTESDDTAAPTPPPTISGLVEPTCLADNLLGFSGLPQTTPAVPEPMPIAQDFEPVRVVTCEGAWHRSEAVEVVDHTVRWTEEHYEGDMAAVLAGYRLPSEPPPEN